MSLGLRAEKFSIVVTTMDICKSAIFCFRLEIPFLGKFGPKIKTFSLNWNLVPRLMQICRIQWWFWFFPFSTMNTFFSKSGPKIQNCLKRNLVPELIQICRIQWFLRFRLEIPFLANFVQNINTVSLSWSLVPRLIWIFRIKWWCSLHLLFFFGQKCPFLVNFDAQNLSC